MRAVVVEDQLARVVLGQRPALVVPDGQLVGVAVHEDHRQVGGRGTDLLDVQPHAVRGQDIVRAVALSELMRKR